MEVKPIPSKDTYPFLLNIHYAKRIPSISFAFGLFINGALKGVCTFGQPASPSLCAGLLGVENRKKVIELNRLCLLENNKNEASFLVSRAIRGLPKGMAVVSYADTAQGHQGVVYQACNFLFTGTTKPRTDMASANGKHSRHSLGDPTNRVPRSAKHRYVFLHGTKIDRKNLLAQLRYPVLPYPKAN